MVAITYTLGSSITNQGSAFTAQYQMAVDASVRFFEHAFTNNVSLNLDFEYVALSSGSANNSGPADAYSYTSVRSALLASAVSADDNTGYGTLPASDPTGSTNTSDFKITQGQAKALGLSFSGAQTFDATIRLNTAYASSWVYDPNNRTGGLDAIAALEHEISEFAFGRIGSLGSSPFSGYWTALDLFRSNSSGQRNLSSANADTNYFSIDGTHLLQRYSTQPGGGDYVDWYGNIVGDSFGTPYYNTAGLVTPTDLREIDVQGWTRAPATTCDFSGNAVSDILFFNQSGGDLWYGAMNASFQGWHHVGGYNTSLNVVGVGDFNADYTSDVLFRNNSTGDLWYAAMSNGGIGTGIGNTPGNDLAGTLAGWVHLGGSSAALTVVGTGYFSGPTGDSNILFRNNASGDLWSMQLSGGQFHSWQHIGGSSATLTCKGTGDFFGNGTSDILFQDANSADTWIAVMSNGAFQSWDHVGNLANNGLQEVAIGDFFGIGGGATGPSGNGGTSDILYRNNSNGDMWIAVIKNGAFQSWDHVGGSSASLSVVAVGDYYGNGVDDILLRNNANGDTWMAAMNNGALASLQHIGGSSTTLAVFNNGVDNGSGIGEIPTGVSLGVGTVGSGDRVGGVSLGVGTVGSGDRVGGVSLGVGTVGSGDRVGGFSLGLATVGNNDVIGGGLPLGTGILGGHDIAGGISLGLGTVGGADVIGTLDSLSRATNHG